MTLSSILLIVLNLDISAGIAFLILSLAVILIYIFLPNISVSKILKFDKTFENTENKYEFYEDYLDYKLTQDFIRYHIVRSDLKDAITSITEVGNDRFVRNITKILRMKLMVIGKVIL